MTTIVYDHKAKQIAFDSRETAGGSIVTDSADKWLTNDTGAWFICGAKSDKKIFTDTFNHNDEARKNLECNGIVVIDGVAFKACIESGIYKLDEIVSNEGLGSGGWFAQAAVDLGKSAKEAVEYAMTRDIYTGGKVHVYDVEQEKFI